MGFFEIVLIACGLAMDAFAVSLGAGSSGQANGRGAAFRLSFHFGLFQAMMPIIGWLAGRTIEVYIKSFDHWIAMGLLAFVGIRMIRSGMGPAEEKADPCDPSRGMTLVMLAIATSIDALAVGLSLAMIDVSIWYPSAVIGVITAGLSLLGLKLGCRLSGKFGQRMEIIGGVVLILIGLRIVASHIIIA